MKENSSSPTQSNICGRIWMLVTWKNLEILQRLLCISKDYLQAMMYLQVTWKPE